MRRAIIAWPVLFCLLAVSGCVNPLAFGPGRVKVTLERVAVQRLTRGTLLPDSDPAWRDRLATIVRFDVSSRTNLARYFEDWGRLVQTRCYVDGAADGRNYTNFAIGPLQDGIDISMWGTHANEAVHLGPDSDGKYWYTVYGFLDLTAEDEKYVDGKPRGTFDLSSQEFSSVGCFVIGVSKAPVIFPRTNTFSMSERDLKDAISNLKHAAAQQTAAGDVRGRTRLSNSVSAAERMPRFQRTATSEAFQ